jgi:DNA-binding NarL/FixJ family response regulator
LNHPSRITVMLVDDEPLIHMSVRNALQQDPEMRVVCSAYDGVEALTLLPEYHPDVVLLDIQMPHMNGIECLKRINQQYPHIVVILLTTFDEEQYIIQGLAHNARSYYLKTDAYTGIADQIRHARNGTFIMPDRIAIKLAKFLHSKKDAVEKTINPVFYETYGLTRTEQHIVQLLGRRLAYAEIADELAVTIGTIRNHVVTIFEKLNVHSRKEAIALIESHFI